MPSTRRAPPRDRGFDFLGSAEARVLILGSLPGRASLRAGQYYAHPRNAFWRILAAVTGVPAHAPYPDRVEGLRAIGIALWDVIASGRRAGSLDADIDPASIRANDFARLFASCPCIRVILCNGTAAHALFRTRVLPSLSPPWRDLPLLRLPSTSPAHAGMAEADKAALWRRALHGGF